MNRTELAALDVGDSLQHTLDVVGGTKLAELKPNARWSNPRVILSISGVELDYDGRLYRRGYCAHGTGGAISFSITEGESDYRVAE